MGKLEFIEMAGTDRVVWDLFDPYFVYHAQYWEDVECWMEPEDRALVCSLGLPVIEERRLWKVRPASPGVEFDPVTIRLEGDDRPRVFLLDRPDGSRYLVDTEGADYCRFLARVY